MKKPTDPDGFSVSELLGLGSHSARKSYYPELTARMAELENERNRYKWLFENALHGIFQASMSGGLRAANPALASMLGDASVAETLKRCTTLEALFVDPGDLQRLRRRLVREGRVAGFTTRLRGREGHEVAVSMTLLPKPNGGEASLVEAFVADITERERARRRLEELNAELEARVQARTRELEALNAELRDARDAAEHANRSKDRYLAAASHDLLQPMNAARLMVATLQERPLAPAEAELARSIHLSLEGAEELLTDLLDIARLDHDRIQPQLNDFCLAELASQLMAEYAPRAREKGLSVRQAVGRWRVNSDFRLLGRVLRNFLSNACRYTESGRVLLGTRRRGEAVWLEVWDTGPGIPPDQRRVIFHEFHQLGASRARDRQGVGLGLAIVERIVTRLGLEVRVDSWPGQGSCFAVRVPLARGRPLPPCEPPGPAPPPVRFAGQPVLVIDNEPSILAGMGQLLRGWGLDCHLALDVEEALEACPEAPAALLVDLHLDGPDTGDALVERLRAHWRAPALPAVVITADRSDAWRQRLRDAGLHVLNKPLRPGKLRVLLHGLLTHDGLA
ncbi:ATP-binding protein [Halomonas mongoliensis]|uniref:ATP-binding protein n=1 Tax=Halomonas mongoliensis TaxID=321265 RepID=UPI00403AF543